MKRSPAPSRRQANAFAARPYSMFVGSQQYSKSSNGDLAVPYTDHNSPSKSSNSSSKSSGGRLKRNSSAEFSTASSSSIESVPECDTNTLSTGNKKNGSASRRSTSNLTPPGPSAKTWAVPKSIKKLHTPAGNVFGVHIGKTGICYVSVVTEKGERLIQAFDRNGSLVKSFQSRATKAGKQFEPYQIHETPDGCLAVASGTCVTVWTKEGKLMTEHGRNMFKFAKCLAVRSTGEIIVTDTDNNAVKIISAGGQQISRLEGEFNCPVGVAVDSNDYIIVSDWTDKISIFDADNELVRTFGVKGSNVGELDLPYGVSVDSQNNIVVADMWNHRLSVYSQEGEFLKHLASEPGQSVRMPAYVSVDTGLNADDHRLAVTDFGANAVKVFSY